MIDKETLEAVSASLHYELAQVKSREAYEKGNYAGILLNLRRVEQRAAELRCQHEPMATFSGGEEDVRRWILQAVRYVVYGHKGD